MINYSHIRALCKSRAYVTAATRLFNNNVMFKEKNHNEQIDYLKSICGNNFNQDWNTVKNNILNKQGGINAKNIDSVILKTLLGFKDLNIALSFAEHLKTNKELSLGTTNVLLNLYAELGRRNKLTEEQKQFILDTYSSLYAKYKVLDYTTCECLLRTLCVIYEWEKALKVLDNIHITTVPSHLAYSTIIATLFQLNKKAKAFELINESIRHKRPLQDIAYEGWLNYILRKYKDKKIIAKYMEEIFAHIANNCVVISENTATKFREVYDSLNWKANFSRINKLDGECTCCKNKLQCLSLSDEEFHQLQQNIKDKLIIGSDLFLKTSPEELNKFTDFVAKTAPYDIVLDGLNISYAIGKGSNAAKLNLLHKVVDHFVSQNKKILLFGRVHMLQWQQRTMNQIMRKTCTFFTQNISQDDPYFITAAILSGPDTDIMSKDLLRGHKFILKDEKLRTLFRRWQWQHQWMLFMNVKKGPIIQGPLSFTPCAQKVSETWHVPYEREAPTSSALVNDGIPDLRNWLCLSQK